MKQPEDLFEIRVALRSESVEVERSEQSYSIAAKRTATVVYLEPKHPSSIGIDGAAHQSPMERPAFDAASRHVSRADHDIESRSLRFDSGSQRWQVFRLVAKVRIHREHEFIVPVDRVFETSERRAAEAEFSGSLQTGESRLLGSSLVAPASGAIGRIIIDDQYFDIGRMAKDLVDQARQILDFVVGRNDDQRASGGRQCKVPV